MAALALAVALSEAVEAATAPVAVYGLADGRGSRAREAKAFRQRTATALPAIAALADLRLGSTPLGEAMLAVAPELLAQPSPRRLLVCITDGADGYGSPWVARVNTDLRSRGVETLLLALDCDRDELRRYRTAFGTENVIDVNPATLPAEGLAAIARQITAAAPAD
jgi:hypothetical protein